MKIIVLLFAALLVAGCGEKSSSEGSESATGRIPDLPEISLTVEEQLKTLGFHRAGAFGNKIKGDAVTITSCDEKASGALTIPATIEGKSVTSIEDGAFYACTSLTAVTFLGDAPKAASDEHFYKASPTIYRKPEAKGWGETWDGRPVKLISEKL